MEVGRTEFSFIFVRMVELFYSVMGSITIFPIRTLLMIVNVPALFWLIGAKLSSSIFLVVVIVWAFFQVVILRIELATNSFEQIQVQIRYTLVHLHILSAIVAVLLDCMIRQLRLIVRNYSPGFLLNGAWRISGRILEWMSRLKWAILLMLVMRFTALHSLSLMVMIERTLVLLFWKCRMLDLPWTFWALAIYFRWFHSSLSWILINKVLV